MNVIALVSGGKDSCFNVMKCIEKGHNIVCLANLYPPSGTDELDSYMYQTVGHEALQMFSEAMELPLYRRMITGKPICTAMAYEWNDAKHTNDESVDEVEDLFELLSDIVKKHPHLNAVSVGAIFSDYQRIRVEKVCQRLSLEMLAYLWHANQTDLLDDMINSNLNAILIKTAVIGLDPQIDLGKNLAQMRDKLLDLEKKFGINVCGEGGEFETFVLDCPLFKKKIVVDRSAVIIHSADAFAPVGYLKLCELHLEDKSDFSA